MYFSKCTPQLQLLLGYMEWRFRVLPRATNSGFLSSLQGIMHRGKSPSDSEDHSGTKSIELSEEIQVLAERQFSCW